MFNWYSEKFLAWLNKNNTFEKIVSDNFGESVVQFYPARSDKPIDVRETLRCLGQTELLLKGVLNTIVKSTDSNDTKVEKIRDFVNKRLTYTADQKGYFRPDYWADAYTVYDKKNDDCDGYAILIMTFMRLAGIPAWRRRIVIGKVYTGEMHAYIVYFTEKNNMWCVVEGSYYAGNAMAYFNQVQLTSNAMYGDVWFCFNESGAWSKNKNVFANKVSARGKKKK